MSTTAIVGIVVLLLLAGIFLFSRAGGAPRISSADARSRVAEGAVLVDVRSPSEFRGGHIEGALNIPHTEITRRAAELEPRGQTVILYCASGMRSAYAAKALQSAGFEDVYNLGPMSAW